MMDGGEASHGKTQVEMEDTVRRDTRAWIIREESATDRERWKVSARPATLQREMAAKDEKGEKSIFYKGKSWSKSPTRSEWGTLRFPLE